MKKAFLLIVIITAGFLLMAIQRYDKEEVLSVDDIAARTIKVGTEVEVMGGITYIGHEGNFREYIVIDSRINVYVTDSFNYKRDQQVQIKIRKVSELFYKEVE